MFMLAMAMLVADFPAFDADAAAKVCAKKRTKPGYADIYSDNPGCIADQQADYRRFILVADDAGTAMKASFDRCVASWSEDGRIDWSMVEYCAVGNVDGKQDFALLRASAAAALRPALDKCIDSESKDVGTGELRAPDWADVVTCAHGQVSGARDFALFAAAAKDSASRAALEACRADAADRVDQVIDWDDAVSCAAKGRPLPVPPSEEEDPGEIVVT